MDQQKQKDILHQGVEPWSTAHRLGLVLRSGYTNRYTNEEVLQKDKMAGTNSNNNKYLTSKSPPPPGSSPSLRRNFGHSAYLRHILYILFDIPYTSYSTYLIHLI